MTFKDRIRKTHGGAELDEDAAKLVTLGGDPGPSFVFIPCSVCGGDGAFDESGDRWRECSGCDGTGEVEVGLTSIDMEDLDFEDDEDQYPGENIDGSN